MWAFVLFRAVRVCPHLVLPGSWQCRQLLRAQVRQSVASALLHDMRRSAGHDFHRRRAEFRCLDRLLASDPGLDSIAGLFLCVQRPELVAVLRSLLLPIVSAFDPQGLEVSTTGPADRHNRHCNGSCCGFDRCVRTCCRAGMEATFRCIRLRCVHLSAVPDRRVCAWRPSWRPGGVVGALRWV